MNIPGFKQCKICPYLDKVKSVMHNENGKLVNPTNKPFCTLVNDWVEETTKCEGLAKIETNEYELKCSAVLTRDVLDADGYKVLKKDGSPKTEKYICGNTIGYFNVVVGEKKIIGLMNLRYTPQLLAYRTRDDGLIGFECLCGGSDTRLGKKEFDKNKEKYPNHVKTSDNEEAKFNDPKSTLKSLIINKKV